MSLTEGHKRLLSFGAIGVANTAVDVGIFLILRHYFVPILLANIISTSFALGLSYTLNKKFAFKSQGAHAKSLFLFLLVTLIGLWILQPIVIKLALIVLNTPTVSAVATQLIARPERFFELIAKLSATPVTLVWNYLLYKHIVFKS